MILNVLYDIRYQKSVLDKLENSLNKSINGTATYYDRCLAEEAIHWISRILLERNWEAK